MMHNAPSYMSRGTYAPPLTAYGTSGTPITCRPGDSAHSFDLRLAPAGTQIATGYCPRGHLPRLRRPYGIYENPATDRTHYCMPKCRRVRLMRRRATPLTTRLSRASYGGDYAGCGTLFGKSKDEAKRACWLEKKISKHQECCDRDCSWFSGKGNQSNQCAKVARATAELMQITGGEGGASDLSQQADAQLALLYQQANSAGAVNAVESAKTAQMLGIAALGGGALLLLVALR